MDRSDIELQDIRRLLAELTARVFRIEQALNLPLQAPAEFASPAAAPEAPFAGAERNAPPGAVPPVPPKPAVIASARPSTADLESRIGSHWLNRIGIAAVLVGVSYFLKFAFDNNWIGPTGRVAIGILAGVGIVIWSERFRSRGYRVFSFSLKAVGVGILYLSLYAAFQVYSLVPSSVAFVMMLAVTAATAVMAWAQDAEILAAFALVGGFTTPVLLSTGQNRELALFSYVAILDFGALLLVILKPWRRLLVLSYLGTLLLYVGWYSSYYNRAQLRLTVGFATLFFAIFAVEPLLTRPGEKPGQRFEWLPLALALVNAAVYFLQIYAMFEYVDSRATAWFALALAAVYIFLSRQTRARAASPEAARKVDLLHLALAIGFITVAIPIRLDAHWITMGWFVEAAVLLWVADRIHSELLNVFAVGALALGVGRLLVIDNFEVSRPVLNSRMATYAVAIAVLGAVAWYGARRKDHAGRTAAVVSVVALNLLALRSLSLEVSGYYAQEMASARPGRRWDSAEWTNWQHLKVARDFTYSALWMTYGAMLMVVGFWRRSAFVRWQALVLIAFTVGKVFLYDVSELDRGSRREKIRRRVQAQHEPGRSPVRDGHGVGGTRHARACNFLFHQRPRHPHES
ncbi:MAG TPA: DUF2339 domain-containing protein [Terriglobales bacterium]|nr:DUF2339 domain-containing protein [Terriglobales bacterium]